MPPGTHERTRTTSPSTTPSVDLISKLKTELQSLQLIWWLAHLFVLYNTFKYIFGGALFPAEYYRRALKGALISYGIVLFKTYRNTRPSREFIQRLSLDDNAQYAALAVFFLMAYPSVLQLIPFATFSVFHMMNYLRTTFLPVLLPGPAAQYYDQLLNKINVYQASAISRVAFLEIMIAFNMILNILSRRSGFLMPLLYFQYMRTKYMMNPHTRAAFREFRQLTDKIFHHTLIPPMASGIYDRVVGFLNTFGLPSASPAPATR